MILVHTALDLQEKRLYHYIIYCIVFGQSFVQKQYSDLFGLLSLFSLDKKQSSL